MKITTIALLTMLIAPVAFGQTPTNRPDDSIGFLGASGDPNGGAASAAADLGAAKLVGNGTYLGVAAHLTKKADTPKFQLSTQIQFHVAQLLPLSFGAAQVFWTAEVGPEFMNGLAAAKAQAGAGATAASTISQLKVGYAVGSGPLLSIPLGRHTYLMPHAEMTGGSLQDVGWRGGVLFGFGSTPR